MDNTQHYQLKYTILQTFKTIINSLLIIISFFKIIINKTIVYLKHIYNEKNTLNKLSLI